MATLTPPWLTILDIAERDAKGALLPIAEVLTKQTAIFRTMPFRPANKITWHQYKKRTLLPTWQFSKLDQGYGHDRSTSKTFRADMTTAGIFAWTNEELVTACSTPAEMDAVRSQEERSFIEAGGQAIEELLVSGDADANPEKINGLEKYVNSLSDTDELGKTTVYDNGGTGSDLSSILAVQWDDSVYGIVPPAIEKGIQIKDLGLQTIQNPDDSTRELLVYKTRYKFTMGLVVERLAGLRRLANIETAVGASSNTVDIDLLIYMMNDLPSLDNVICYMNGRILTQLQIAAKDASNSVFSPGEIFGKPVTMYLGKVPFMATDLLTLTESAVS